MTKGTGELIDEVAKTKAPSEVVFSWIQGLECLRRKMVMRETIEDKLGNILKKFYCAGPSMNRSTNIILFGIKYAKPLSSRYVDKRKIAQIGTGHPSYQAEISKGVSLAQHVFLQSKGSYPSDKETINSKRRIIKYYSIKKEFKNFLIKTGKNEETASKFVKSVDSIRNAEKMEWKELFEKISEVPKYDFGVLKGVTDSQEYIIYVNALKKFGEFVQYERKQLHLHN